jgi:hypothetical protein
LACNGIPLPFTKLKKAYKTYNHTYSEKKMEPKEYKRM